MLIIHVMLHIWTILWTLSIYSLSYKIESLCFFKFTSSENLHSERISRFKQSWVPRKSHEITLRWKLALRWNLADLKVHIEHRKDGDRRNPKKKNAAKLSDYLQSLGYNTHARTHARTNTNSLPTEMKFKARAIVWPGARDGSSSAFFRSSSLLDLHSLSNSCDHG